MNKKQLVSVGITMALLLPTLTFADTASDLQTQIQTLLTQVKSLQQQLFSLQGSSTGDHGWGMWKNGSTTPSMHEGKGPRPCVSITRNLKPGHQGDDVKEIQQMLANDSEAGFDGQPTGFFGPKTAEAMKKFQRKFGIGSSTDGSVGPATRRFFDEGCGQSGDSKGPRMDMMGHEGPAAGMLMRGMSAVAGNITANTGTSITIQTDGGAKIVTISPSTIIMITTSTSTPPAPGTAADLSVGFMARAIGKTNTDGSISATNIMAGTMLRPMNMDGLRGHDGPMGGTGDMHNQMMGGQDNHMDEHMMGGDNQNQGPKPPKPWWMPESVQPHN